MTWCPSSISAAGLVGGFNMARRTTQTPTEYELQVWAAQQNLVESQRAPLWRLQCYHFL